MQYVFHFQRWIKTKSSKESRSSDSSALLWHFGIKFPLFPSKQIMKYSAYLPNYTKSAT